MIQACKLSSSISTITLQLGAFRSYCYYKEVGAGVLLEEVTKASKAVCPRMLNLSIKQG